ncbi:bifunctional methylenetetrahydrofolate dehydrogenase/methenyltetrahydrofolate cyclohydrolase FolD [Pleomorphomonas diazotrophica]|uniref:Bifunctional protein FolD n=1 Tax=Pleomorphomonas diazotrophica TaxID=1166257 RepID=A0A1I4UTL5_9HYPH|nr:bifunctional methylenetetrahydrofolate dehydrogenase/methenyltetrahydrofolate cyclohydrolase FolD [Pleomorphomonas diazotrophica]PKR89856.1 bifunctional methylenetetrahydrofolate dehydrogenase/methenyltetrahydrofolate cyclohydrolase FolD [Pleomorphomonas diazotrophica]SFM92093.1 methenyltetrahydrofolate cyclohydrolase /5,10-methylenetetrahydrofolate dehydrogenase (NADP+) [Pleomorphomonas diazotrophica]
MVAEIIDGFAIAAELRRDIAARAAEMKEAYGVVPGLAVVLVGDDPASAVYVRNKLKATAECGLRSVEHVLPANTSEADLLDLVGKLNADPSVHGILVQLPLPKQIDADKVLGLIDPDKDVDGFHPVNAGRLSIGLPGFVPCTPRGSQILIDRVLPNLAGKHAVVIGRSNIVGKPMAQLLLQKNATVTIAHSKTADLPGLCRTADVLVAAVGRPLMVKGDWVKPGAVVIDVGINRIEVDGKGKLVGDVDFASVAEVAGHITPVPKGVGPMTIACLMLNTLDSAARRIAAES